MATPPASTWSDNDVRFARLALAAAEIACGVRDLAWTPDLLHLNDWTSALTPGYLAWRGRPLPSVLTIHNLAYQGLFERRAPAPARRAGERLPDRRRRVLRQAVLPQGRHRLCVARHDGELDLRARDHDARARLRARRALAGAGRRGPAHRHPQRHRRKLGPAHRPVSGKPVRGREPQGQGRQSRRGPQGIRARRVARAALCRGVAARAPEGRRPRDRGGRDHRARRRPDRRHRARRGRARAVAGKSRARAIPTGSASGSASRRGRRGGCMPAAISS